MSSDSDLDTISRLIRNRRTIKPANMDAEKPVPAELLETVLENATWAPTHGMTEPWFFHVYQGDSRQQLADKLQALYRKLIPAENFREDKLTKLGKNPLLAPLVLSIWMKRQPIEKIPEVEEVEAVACAVQNLHLSASAAGLGGFWSSPPFLDSPEASAEFGMGEKDRCLGLFYLGWPQEGLSWPSSCRQPVATKVQHI